MSVSVADDDTKRDDDDSDVASLPFSVDDNDRRDADLDESAPLSTATPPSLQLAPAVPNSDPRAAAGVERPRYVDPSALLSASAAAGHSRPQEQVRAAAVGPVQHVVVSQLQRPRPHDDVRVEEVDFYIESDESGNDDATVSMESIDPRPAARWPTSLSTPMPPSALRFSRSSPLKSSKSAGAALAVTAATERSPERPRVRFAPQVRSPLRRDERADEVSAAPVFSPDTTAGGVADEVATPSRRFAAYAVSSKAMILMPPQVARTAASPLVASQSQQKKYLVSSIATAVADEKASSVSPVPEGHTDTSPPSLADSAVLRSLGPAGASARLQGLRQYHRRLSPPLVMPDSVAAASHDDDDPNSSSTRTQESSDPLTTTTTASSADAHLYDERSGKNGAPSSLRRKLPGEAVPRAPKGRAKRLKLPHSEKGAAVGTGDEAPKLSTRDRIRTTRLGRFFRTKDNLALRFVLLGSVLALLGCAALLAFGTYQARHPNPRVQAEAAVSNSLSEFYGSTAAAPAGAGVATLDSFVSSFASITAGATFSTQRNVSFDVVTDPIPLVGNTADDGTFAWPLQTTYLAAASMPVIQTSAASSSSLYPMTMFRFTLGSGTLGAQPLTLSVPIQRDSDSPPPKNLIQGYSEEAMDSGPWYLLSVCVVVKRASPGSAQFVVDTTYLGCEYPFTSQMYSVTASDAVTVRVRLSDDPYLAVQEETTGTMLFAGKSLAAQRSEAAWCIVLAVLLALPTSVVAVQVGVELWARRCNLASMRKAWKQSPWKGKTS